MSLINTGVLNLVLFSRCLQENLPELSKNVSQRKSTRYLLFIKILKTKIKFWQKIFVKNWGLWNIFSNLSDIFPWQDLNQSLSWFWLYIGKSWEIEKWKIVNMMPPTMTCHEIPVKTVQFSQRFFFEIHANIGAIIDSLQNHPEALFPKSYTLYFKIVQNKPIHKK